eukprot:CAMPEP_0119298242 /NCGR_PEP_ID=MMETSP1333-20130426/452_1 /TAXON_ID=418940 /ORGANISM="Scyphosphaera apsteinii, Strain RCC1455" /LENGTH=51 /DNA_ID=CAMNT_0007299295 /DNA_START=50 /DNA_END=205 /DNA_ORIENTATION=+
MRHNVTQASSTACKRIRRPALARAQPQKNRRGHQNELPHSGPSNMASCRAA